MKKRNENVIAIRLVKILNVLLATLPFALAWIFYFSTLPNIPMFKGETILIIFLFSILYFIFGRIYDAFQISLVRIQELIYSQALAELVTDAIMTVVIWLAIQRFPNFLIICLVYLTQIFLSVLWSVVAHKWFFKHNSPKETIIIYDSREGLDNLIKEYEEDKKFEVKKTYHINDLINNIECLKHTDVVFLSGIHSHERNVILKFCVENGVSTFIVPRIGDVIMSGAHKMHLLHLPILQVGRYSPSPEYLVSKRLLDIIISSIGLIALSPLFLVTAIAVKSDGGPVFYKQERLTKDGEKFDLLKFRSMKVDAESDGVARLSSGDQDPRITKVGRVIRMIRLDEIPQLINILKGDMTLVGPRPERPSIANEYASVIPEFRLRLQAKAGLTGYAQVYGKYNTTPYDKLLMDLMYISSPSLIEDLKIIFATIKILFLPDSTEGVGENQITAINDKS